MWALCESPLPLPALEPLENQSLGLQNGDRCVHVEPSEFGPEAGMHYFQLQMYGSRGRPDKRRDA